MIQAAQNLYGEINCEIIVDPELESDRECYGMTQWFDDGEVLITLGGRTSIEKLAETLGHELAHVVVNREEKSDHGEKWESTFNAIFEEYSRYCELKYGGEK